MNGHRSAKDGCSHEIHHYKEACNGYNFQILEKLPGNGYNSSGEVDPDMLTIRKAKENEWIKKLLKYKMEKHLQTKVFSAKSMQKDLYSQQVV